MPIPTIDVTVASNEVAKSIHEWIQDASRDLPNLSSKEEHVFQAYQLFQRFSLEEETMFSFGYVPVSSSQERHDEWNFYKNGFNIDLFNECLAMHGLRVVNSTGSMNLTLSRYD